MKIHRSYYLEPHHLDMLNRIYTKRIMANKKTSLSALLGEAIEMLALDDETFVDGKPSGSLNQLINTYDPLLKKLSKT